MDTKNRQPGWTLSLRPGGVSSPEGRHPSMLRVLLLWAMLVVLMAPSGAWGEEPEVVARVNGEPVTRAELERVLANPATRLQLLKEIGSQDPDRNELERLALHKLIIRSLFLQEAARRNFTVTEQELNLAFSKFKSRFKKARRFAAWKKARGQNDTAIREDLRAQLLVRRARAAVAGEARLTEEEVQAYYEANTAHWRTAEKEGQPSRTKSLAEVRAEIERRLLPAKREEAVRAWLTEREQHSKIEVFPPPGSSARKPSVISSALSALDTDASAEDE